MQSPSISLPQISYLVNKVIEEADIINFLKKKIVYDEQKNSLKISGTEINIGNRDIHLIAFGKASERMSRYFLELLENKIHGGIIVVPRNAPFTLKIRQDKFTVIKSGHPIPDEGSLLAGERILEYVSSLSEKDFVIYLISGGGSSLVEKPIKPITMEDLRKTSKLLLESGASIGEINTVRKHLSQIKGGQLARKTYPAKNVSLLVSDVPGDKPEDIASGPTVPDPTTFSDALSIIDYYELREDTPKSVIEVLEKGKNGLIPDTPKLGDKVFDQSYSKVIASPAELLYKLTKYTLSMGYKTHILTSQIKGESSEVAKALASIAKDILNEKSSLKPPIALLIGGETSVRVKGSGWGGRAQELIVWFAKETNGIKEIKALAIDTDGIDGNTPVAGAYSDHETWVKIQKEFGKTSIDHLKQNNTYLLLEKTGYTIETGYTGTNLNNIIIILIDKKPKE